MQWLKLKKTSWLLILASSFIMVSCGDSDNGDNGSDNDNGKTEENLVCDCELNDNNCINTCIRTVCSCEQSTEIDACAGNCQTAGSCGIVKMNGDFNPMDPSSWNNISVEVKVTSKDQLACMKTALPECNDSFQKTCDGDRVKSCVSGKFSYQECDGKGCNAQTASCNTNSTDDDECNSSFQKTCDGDRVKSCVDGHFSYESCNGKGCEEAKCKTSSGTTCDPATCNGDYKCNDSNECVFDTTKLPTVNSPCNSEDIDKCLDNGKLALVCYTDGWGIEECNEDPCVAQKDDPNHMLLYGCGFNRYNYLYSQLDDEDKDQITFRGDGYYNTIKTLDNNNEYYMDCPAKIYEGDDNKLYGWFKNSMKLKNTEGCVLCDAKPELYIRQTACHTGNSCNIDTCINNKDIATCYNNQAAVRKCFYKCETTSPAGVTFDSCVDAY